MAKAPKTNGEESATRDEKGRFLHGNPGGPGNPYGRATGLLRAALYKTVTPERMVKMTRAVMAKAMRGDVPAYAEICKHTLGRAADLEEKLDELQRILAEITAIQEDAVSNGHPTRAA